MGAGANRVTGATGRTLGSGSAAPDDAGTSRSPSSLATCVAPGAWSTPSGARSGAMRAVTRLQPARRGHDAAVDREQVGLGERTLVGHRHAEQDLALALGVPHGPPPRDMLRPARRPAQRARSLSSSTSSASRASIRSRICASSTAASSRSASVGVDRPGRPGTRASPSLGAAEPSRAAAEPSRAAASSRPASPSCGSRLMPRSPRRRGPSPSPRARPGRPRPRPPRATSSRTVVPSAVGSTQRSRPSACFLSVPVASSTASSG